MTKTSRDTEPTESLPRDSYSEAHRRVTGHPTGVVKMSLVEETDFYGHIVTWNIKTVRVEGEDTVFIQRQDGLGADRLVLPPQVTAILARHRDGAATVNRKRAARAGAATRKAQGFVPNFVKKAGGA